MTDGHHNTLAFSMKQVAKTTPNDYDVRFLLKRSLKTKNYARTPY
jgi:hypothetical protein